MRLSKLLPILLCVVGLVAIAYELWHGRARVAVAAAPAPPPPPPPTAGGKKGLPVDIKPLAPVPWAAPIIAPRPGAPRAFPTQFREQTVAFYQNLVTERLGADFPLEKRKEIAKIQNRFWDEQGANVDAFEDHRISQPEFAERTHVAMSHWAEGFGKLLNEDEHTRLLDVPPGTDVYPLLFHGPTEQPGMPVNAYDNGEQHNSYANVPAPPPAPPASGPKLAPPLTSTGAPIEPGQTEPPPPPPPTNGGKQ